MSELVSQEPLRPAVAEHVEPAGQDHADTGRDAASSHADGHTHTHTHTHNHVHTPVRAPLALSLMAQPAWVRVVAVTGLLVLLWLAILWAVMLP